MAADEGVCNCTILGKECNESFPYEQIRNNSVYTSGEKGFVLAHHACKCNKKKKESQMTSVNVTLNKCGCTYTQKAQ